jgi:hypothetical protein
MTKLLNDYEGGINGVVVTTANSGGGIRTAFTAVSSTVTYTNANSTSRGALSGTCSDYTTTSNVRWALANPTAANLSNYYWVTAATTADLLTQRLSVTGDTTGATVRINTASKLRLTDSANTIIWTATNTFPLNQWVRIELWANSTTGQARLAYFLGDSTTPAEDSGIVTGSFGGGAAFVNARHGLLGTATGYGGSLYWDDAQVWTDTDATSSLIGPFPAAASYTASAGADQTNVEPWSTVTLTGTDTGSPTTRAWTQTGGAPSVTISGASTTTPTFTAPGTIAGTTLTFTYTVSGSGAPASSATNVTVLPVTERAVIGGVEVPMQIRVS